MAFGFRNGLKAFIDFACSNQDFMDEDKIKCPCIKFDNWPYLQVEDVKHHLARFGFTPNYRLWDRHGETSVGPTSSQIDDSDRSFNEQDEPSYREMVTCPHLYPYPQHIVTLANRDR